MPRNKRQRERGAAGQPRSLDSLRREAGSRSSDKLLIVCEGAKTERIYFEALRGDYKLRAVEVEIVGVGGAPITVVDEALVRRAAQITGGRGRNESPFDAVWCVFDTEIPHENASLAEAIDKARANGLRLAVSNPAFEFWYLLHFRFTTKPYHNADEVRADLRAHLTNYAKNKSPWPELAPKTETAIAHAKRVPIAEEPYPQPSTTVYQLVEQLIAMRRW